LDRRTTFATLLGRRSEAATTLLPLSSDLSPYTGPWGWEQAAHLLRRSTFGPTYATIKRVQEQGLELTLEELLQDLPLPDPPLNNYYDGDPNVPIGETWIDAPYVFDTEVLTYRSISLIGHTFGCMMDEAVSVREKLSLFWHNHFAINAIEDPKYLYRYISTIRQEAIGDFRALVKAITIDPVMLRFLNGNQNTGNSPNENYARELLELFTIGKGPLAGPGDYTYYTEEDIRQLARVLTGWRDRGYLTPLGDVPVSSYFIPARHDAGSKQLSNRFDNVVITDRGETEYSYAIDLILQRKQCARFIARKLYRWFVYYVIDEQTEANVIEPLADLLYDNDYQIKPALRALFASQHFYDMLNVGPMIKNPIDFTVGLLKQGEAWTPEEAALREQFLTLVYGFSQQQEMAYFSPPDVAGWKAYYQGPAYYRLWINANTLPDRMELSAVLAWTGFGAREYGQAIQIDVLRFIEQLSRPEDPDRLIGDLVALFLPQPLTQAQLDGLKEVLIPGLPNFEWTVEYTNYLDNPEDDEIRKSVELKLRSLFVTMLTMPEFFLS